MRIALLCIILSFAVWVAVGATAAKVVKPTPSDEAEGKIDGLVIPRAKGGFLGLKIVRSNFVLSFYDAKKKPVEVDVTRAAIRWPVKYQPQDEHTVLNPSSDKRALVSARTVRPPYNFKVYLSLFVEGNDHAVESYTLDYHD